MADFCVMKNKILMMTICFITSISYRVAAQTFTLTSNYLSGQFTGKFIANVFGCTGDNKSPQLAWSAAPAGTKSFAITMYDPDAPTGSGWWHWVVFNIPANVFELKQGAGNIAAQLMPDAAIQSLTDFGIAGYGGPCPPENDKPHAYIITVYALKIADLGIDKTASPALVGFIINQNILAKASLIVYSKR